MITAVLDTNVFIQTLIGTPRSASARTLRALDDGRFRLAFCPATIDELLDVLALQEMRYLHGLSDDAILTFVQSFLPDALILPDPVQPPASLPRDVTDTKFLGLAAAARAVFLVTNDRRHLLRLEQYQGTRIVAPREFLRQLP
jgi:putative PIN family toxin of toxin-antitoxin system